MKTANPPYRPIPTLLLLSWVGFLAIMGVSLSGFRPYEKQDHQKHYQTYQSPSPVLSLFWESESVEEDIDPDGIFPALSGSASNFFSFSSDFHPLSQPENTYYWIRRINRTQLPLYLLFHQTKLDELL